MAVDHYKTLGVIPSATTADLRAAYLKLARANHPDRFDGHGRDAAQVRMQQINEAWNVLGVARKRREYDVKQQRPTSRQGSAPGSGSASHGPGQQRRGHAHFRPFDDGPIDRSEIDIDLDSTPIVGSKGIPRWVTFLPVVLFVFGILTLGFGTMVDAPGVFALGIVSLVFGGVCFVMLPLVVMSRAERDPDL
jgi:hypothetical protein